MARANSGDGTVGKAVEILDRVAEFGRPVRFTELHEACSFPKATAYRLVQTLTSQGMLGYDPDRQTYTPGMRLVRLAHAAWAQSSLAPLARPFIDALASDVNETVHLAQLDAAHVLYVDKRTPDHEVEMFSSAGKVGPAYCTGVGKAMLAFLDKETLEPLLRQQSFHKFTSNTYTSREALRRELKAIRLRGHAYDREEHEPGIICVALPILSGNGRVIGAVSVTSTCERSSLEDLDGIVPRVRVAAQSIADSAQHWQFPDEFRQISQTGT